MNKLSPIFQPKTYQQKDISRPTGHGNMKSEVAGLKQTTLY